MHILILLSSIDKNIFLRYLLLVQNTSSNQVGELQRNWSKARERKEEEVNIFSF